MRKTQYPKFTNREQLNPDGGKSVHHRRSACIYFSSFPYSVCPFLTRAGEGLSKHIRSSTPPSFLSWLTFLSVPFRMALRVHLPFSHCLMNPKLLHQDCQWDLKSHPWLFLYKTAEPAIPLASAENDEKNIQNSTGGNALHAEVQKIVNHWAEPLTISVASTRVPTILRRTSLSFCIRTCRQRGKQKPIRSQVLKGSLSRAKNNTITTCAPGLEIGHTSQYLTFFCKLKQTLMLCWEGSR